MATGATQQLTAQGKMSDGSTSGATVTYAATGGTVSTSGLYKAGMMAGTNRVIAVQQGGTKAHTSAITVTTTAPALRCRGADAGDGDGGDGGDAAVDRSRGR